MKSFLTRFKLFILIITSVLIVVPVIVAADAAINTMDGGYQILHGFLATTTVWTVATNPGDSDHGEDKWVIMTHKSDATFHRLTNDINDNSNVAGACILNRTKDTDFFVPTRTVKEWTDFYNNKPTFAQAAYDKESGTDKLIPVYCEGDGVCDTLHENCQNSADCVCDGVYSAAAYQKQVGTTMPLCFGTYPNIHTSSYSMSNTPYPNTAYMCATMIKATKMQNGNICLTGIEKTNNALPKYCLGHYNARYNRCVYYGTFSPTSYTNGGYSTIKLSATSSNSGIAYNTIDLSVIASSSTVASWGDAQCDNCFEDGLCCNFDGICNQPDDQNCPDCATDCTYHTISHGYVAPDCTTYCDDGYHVDTNVEHQGCLPNGGGGGCDASNNYCNDDRFYWPESCDGNCDEVNWKSW